MDSELITLAMIAFPFGLLKFFAGFFVFLAQVACILFIRPFSRRMYKRVIAEIMVVLWSQDIWAVQWWGGVKVHLFTDPETFELLGKESALIISNHQYDIDTSILWILAQQFNCLGSASVFSKNFGQYIPLIGWAHRIAGHIFLKRKWPEDQVTIKSGLRALKDFPCPFWLISFVEGSRISQERLTDARKYAVSNGLPPPRNVLVPRTKGFVETVKYIRSFVPAIYDVTIVVPQGATPPTSLNVAKKRPSVVNVHIRRHSMKELPESDEGTRRWLLERFVAKDDLIDKFAAEGTFGGHAYCNIRPKKSLIVTVFWWLALYFSMYRFFIRFSILSSWKRIALSTSFLVFILASLCFAFSTAQLKNAQGKKEKPIRS